MNDSAKIFKRCDWLITNRKTPTIINNLCEYEVFVFGSKPSGNHISGAAKVAVEKYGAKQGLAEGFSGKSYAIPVHKHRTNIMGAAINHFVKYAKEHAELIFFVLPIGCGKAGMDVNLVAQMFLGAIWLDNIFLPESFIKAIRRSVIVSENEPLPIKYVIEGTNADVLRGRLMGLMQKISTRTHNPIKFDDDVLKQSNILLFSFLRIAKIATKEENRVMTALMDEAKFMSESGIGKESDNDTVRALEFVIGWKRDAKEMFDNGGSMYDLLVFTDRNYIKEHKAGKYKSTKEVFTSNKILYPKGSIAIARDFAVVLKENGWELELIGHNEDFKQLSSVNERHFVKLAAGFDGYMALDNEGKVVPGPKAREFEIGEELKNLRCVKDIMASEGHVVALHFDKTVTCIDEPGAYEGPPQLASKVSQWKGIIQAVCGFDFVAGLKVDGSTISVGQYFSCDGQGFPQWKNVKQFDAYNNYYGSCFAIALLNDGKVVCDFDEEVEQWQDVVKVCVGNHGHAVGLKSDNTAYAIGDEKFVKTVTSWKNIAEIECKFFQCVALLKDGAIVYCNFD